MSARPVTAPATRQDQRTALLTADQVMRRRPVLVQAHEHVVSVWERMQVARTEVVVVLEGTRCLGVVDAHDIWAMWALQLTQTGDQSIRRLVSQAPVVNTLAPLRVVCQALLRSAHGAVLVTDPEQRLVGTITSPDVVNAIVENENEEEPC